MRHAAPFAALALSLGLLGCSSDPNTQGPGAPDASQGDAASSGGAASGTGGKPSGGAGGAASGSGGKGAAGGSGGKGAASGGAGGSSSGGATGSGGRSGADASADSSRSVPDASQTDGGTPTDSGASAAEAGIRPPIAHFGQVRFVNLAPDSPPLDICMRETGTTSYGSPILRANGVTTGLPFGSQSKYIDLGLSASKYYDFVYTVASTASCTPSAYGFIGTRIFWALNSTTIANYEATFGLNSYNAAQMADTGDQAPHTGNVRLYYASQGADQGVDLHATWPNNADQTWFTNIVRGMNTGFHWSAASTYSFRATLTGTQTLAAQKSGVTVGPDAPIDLFLYPSDATHTAFFECPSLPTATVAPCTP